MRGLNVGGKLKPLGFVGSWDTLQYSGNRYKEQDMSIDHDLCSMDAIPKENDYYDLIYSSHTFEHLLDSHLVYVVSECFRILKDGGFLRIVAPNSMQLLNMYLNGQTINWKYGGFSEFDSFFYNVFQILSEQEKTINCRKIDEKEFRSILSSKGPEETFDILAQVVAEIIEKEGMYSGSHVNPLYPAKMERILKECGFTNIKNVEKNRGFTVMRNAPLNQTLPWGSFYTICQK